MLRSMERYLPLWNSCSAADKEYLWNDSQVRRGRKPERSTAAKQGSREHAALYPAMVLVDMRKLAGVHVCRTEMGGYLGGSVILVEHGLDHACQEHAPVPSRFRKFVLGVQASVVLVGILVVVLPVEAKGKRDTSYYHPALGMPVKLAHQHEFAFPGRICGRESE